MMKANEKAKHVQDVTTGSDTISARRPFKVSRENRRRFIRLEIASPMALHRIKDTEGHYWSESDWQSINGTILNISASGVLVDLDQAVDEGDVVSMHFRLQDVENLDDILGLVKRTDVESEGCLAGIEFVTREYLADHFSQAEMELLGDRYTNFNNSVRQVLNKYVTRQAEASTGV
jgi:hypothetical protein